MGKILITGAGGFIGSHLVDYLLKNGFRQKDLRLFLYKNESLENLQYRNLEIVRGDIRKPMDLKKAVDGVDKVCHLAALTMDGEGSYLDVNWTGTKNLLKAIDTSKVSKFVFFSTIAVFGLPAFIGNKANINEESEKDIVGEYALSKYKAEREVIKVSDKHGMPYVIIRPTTVYGPRDKAGIYQLIKAINGNYFVQIGNGSNKMDYVYVEDVAKAAYLALIGKRKSGDYIIGAKYPLTLSAMVGTIYSSLRKKKPSFYMPRSIGLLIGRMLDFLSKLVGFRNPLSTDRVRVLTANYYFSSKRAENEINYVASVSFTDGIKKTIKWLKENNKI